MKHSHYKRDISKLNLKVLDVYRLIDLFNITCPVAQHVFKKSMAAGQRGHKDLLKDWQDILDSAERRLEMLDEDAQAQKIEPASEIDDDSPRQQGIQQSGELAEHIYGVIYGACRCGNAEAVGSCSTCGKRY